MSPFVTVAISSRAEGQLEGACLPSIPRVAKKRNIICFENVLMYFFKKKNYRESMNDKREREIP